MYLLSIFARVPFLVFGVIGLCAATDVYLYCSAEDWIEESSIDFECYVLKSSYPSKCDAPIPDVVRFRLDPTSRDGYTPICSLSNITTSCFASSSQCSCQTGNTTHYKFQFTFTAASNYSGFWDCSVPCFNGLRPALLYSNDHCENRRVTATTTPAPTTRALPGTAMSTTTGVDDTSDSHKTCVSWIVVGVTVALWQWMLLCVLH